MTPSTFIPARRRVGRKRAIIATSEPTPPPVALVLVSATYDPGLSVTLTFDRPINVTGFNGAFVIVRDGNVGQWYDAMAGAVLIGPNVAELTLVLVEADSSVGVTMNVSPENGIVAVDDGGTWGGVAELPLPFPP